MINNTLSASRRLTRLPKRLILIVVVACILMALIATRGLSTSYPCETTRNLKFQVGDGDVLDEYTQVSDKICTRPIFELDSKKLLLKKRCGTDPLNFFLLWSTKREDFRLKHYRVIDSIFTHHPDARLHILTSNMTIDDFSYYKDQQFDIVHHYLDTTTIFKDTPLQRWAHNIPQYKLFDNYFSHLTDAMRLALLWKYGGIYLDTDAIIMRNMAKVRNALGVQHPSEIATGEINGAVMVFDRMHPYLYYAMHLLMSTYDPKVWDIAGPQVVTKAVTSWSALQPFMVRWIPEHKAGDLELPNEPFGTPSIMVFKDRYAFYAYPWWIRPGRIDANPDHPDFPKYRKDVEERAYAYHYVNQMVRETHTKIKKGIYLYDLLQRACMYECDHEDLDVSIVDLPGRK